jgi:hypothetical protein
MRDNGEDRGALLAIKGWSLVEINPQATKATPKEARCSVAYWRRFFLSEPVKGPAPPSIDPTPPPPGRSRKRPLLPLGRPASPARCRDTRRRAGHRAARSIVAVVHPGRSKFDGHTAILPHCVAILARVSRKLNVLLDGEHAGRLKARAGFEAAVAEAVTTFGPAKPRGSDSRS